MTPSNTTRPQTPTLAEGTKDLSLCVLKTCFKRQVAGQQQVARELYLELKLEEGRCRLIWPVLASPKVLHVKLTAILIHQLLQKLSAWQRGPPKAYSDCMEKSAMHGDKQLIQLNARQAATRALQRT